MGGRGGSMSGGVGAYRDEPSGGITYTLGNDVPAALRGKKLTGGKVMTITYGGQRVEVVRFDQKFDGKPLDVRTSARPDLKAKVNAYNAEVAAVKEHNAKVFEKRVPGLKQVEEAHANLSNSIDANRASAERARNTSRGSDYNPVSTSAQASVKALERRYPKAALYAEAKRIAANTSWADNTGKGAAAHEAMEILRKGGTIKAAKAALAKRSGSSY